MNLKTAVKKRSELTAILFGILFILGTAIRIGSGSPVLSSDMVFAKDEIKEYPIANSPASTALLFYRLIDDGVFDRAWELALEPDWSRYYTQVGYRDPVSSEGRPFPGWTPKQDFIDRMEGEIGKNGWSLKLNSIEADRIGTASAPDYAGGGTPHLVKIRGHMLGACTIFSWEKDVTVIESGGKYKVLLDGTKQSKNYFYQSWFSARNKISDLRK
jgi:hypothetical protein